MYERTRPRRALLRVVTHHDFLFLGFDVKAVGRGEVQGRAAGVDGGEVSFPVVRAW
jgi:hypothetical protein